MPTYYPVFLNLEGRLCVIIGAGEVAERKAKLLRECGASIAFISPEVTPALRQMAERGEVQWRQRGYQPGDLEGAFLAIAATDDNKVNRAVRREARERNVLLNVVDVPHLCDFIAPSIVRRDEITIAISTGGLSPALARRMREEMQECRGACDALRWAESVSMLGEVRNELRSRGVQPDPETWQASMDRQLLSLVENGDRQAARELLLARLTQHAAPLR